MLDLFLKSRDGEVRVLLSLGNKKDKLTEKE
jgi:hypothetical protein